MSPTRNAATSSSTAKTPKGKITAKTESQELAAANDARVALTITNRSARDVWLGLGGAAAAEEGICLKAETGAMVIDFFMGAVFVITKEGEGVITFSEV